MKWWYFLNENFSFKEVLFRYENLIMEFQSPLNNNLNFFKFNSISLLSKSLNCEIVLPRIYQLLLRTWPHFYQHGSTCQSNKIELVFYDEWIELTIINLIKSFLEVCIDVKTWRCLSNNNNKNLIQITIKIFFSS